MMDKLRTAGPWESEQTHDSLRRYLLEETYELFDAVRSGNADELREELGDVLLQVLFHARIAEDAPAASVHHRRRRRFAGAQARQPGARRARRRADFAGRSARAMGGAQGRWKRREGRPFVMDDVPTGQPALALAQKVIDRVSAAGLPADLIPGCDHVGRGVGRWRRRKRVADRGFGVHGHRAHRREGDRGRPSRRGRARGARHRLARGDHRGGVARVLAVRRARRGRVDRRTPSKPNPSRTTRTVVAENVPTSGPRT